MEIEKKYKIKYLPENLEKYPKRVIEQGYLCGNPIIRIRKSDTDFILTYKSRIGINEEAGRAARVCNEVEVPLNEEGYLHLREKVDGHFIHKIRYLIPLENGLKAELDLFFGCLLGLQFVEVEFESEEMAQTFQPPKWFGEDVSFDKRYGNHFLSTVDGLEPFEG